MNKQLKKELPYIALFTFYAVMVSGMFYNLKDHKQIEWGSWATKVQAEEIIPEPEPVYENEYQKIIYEVFDDDVQETMYAISQAEHRGTIDPFAVNSTEIEHSVGLFQINLAKDYGNGKHVHWDKVPGENLKEKELWLQNPYNNALIARQIYNGQGLHAWSVYNDGKYKTYQKTQD